MTSKHRSISWMDGLFRCIGLLFLVVPIACAQPENGGDDAQRLPDEVLGTWAPVSRSSLQFGDLVMDAETLSWSTCVKEPYRVLQSRDSAWLIELVRSPACPLRAGQTPLLLEISPNNNVLNLSLSTCRDVADTNRPEAERQSCSRSMFAKGK
jgi:hypothetical protein